MNKVDRALEMQVIDWLQWSEFPEDIGKRPDDSDMAQLTLELMGKRKNYCKELETKLTTALELLGEADDSVSNYHNALNEFRSFECSQTDRELAKAWDDVVNVLTKIKAFRGQG